MINKVVLSDLERFNELGRLVNDNFNNLFDLSSLIGSKTDYVYGYYALPRSAGIRTRDREPCCPGRRRS